MARNGRHYPEILQSNLGSVVMQLKKLGINVVHFASINSRGELVSKNVFIQTFTLHTLIKSLFKWPTLLFCVVDTSVNYGSPQLQRSLGTSPFTFGSPAVLRIFLFIYFLYKVLHFMGWGHTPGLVRLRPSVQTDFCHSAIYVGCVRAVHLLQMV